MTDDNKAPEGRKPTLRDRMRPVEFLGIAGVLSVFVGLIVLMSTREPILALIFFGVAFIVTLVVLAIFALGFKPDDEERRDLAEQNHERPELPGGDAPRNPHD
ncbi:hypothetical protein GCM10027568_33960 [Humibacter soli]